MKIVLDVPIEVEARLRGGGSRPSPEAVRQWLADALAPTVAALLQDAPPRVSDAEFEALADELTTQLGPDIPSLTDDAVTRAGIYADHP